MLLDLINYFFVLATGLKEIKCLLHNFPNEAKSFFEDGIKVSHSVLMCDNEKWRYETKLFKKFTPCFVKQSSYKGLLIW